VGIVTGTLNDMARTWLAAWATLFMGWLVASRLAILIYQRHLAVHGALREAIALIVLDTVCASDKRALVERLSLKADVITSADRSLSDDSSFKAALTQIVSLAQGGAIGLVVLASNAGQSCGDNAEIINRLKTTPVQVALCDNYQHQEGSSPRLRIIAGFPMRLLVDHPLNRNDLLTKAIMDRVGAVVLLALASPLLAAVALAVLLETEGPIIFRQSRSGCCGKPFNVYKFRTMKHESSDALVHQTVRGDSRFTRIGALLRKTSLDELPQLWNVLVGQMSLVGPRPHADGLHSREREAKFLLDDYAQRQRVKPGLTGWAQVHGLRGAADTPEKLRLRIEMDLYYIEHWTIWLDLRIIARTPWAVLSTENAF
jgi:exopolysaccharide biosynthesis polyprenyl glycosylphosphotransferase